MTEETKELIDRLNACAKQARELGGCNTVPVPMFLFREALTALILAGGEVMNDKQSDEVSKYWVLRFSISEDDQPPCDELEIEVIPGRMGVAIGGQLIRWEEFDSVRTDEEFRKRNMSNKSEMQPEATEAREVIETCGAALVLCDSTDPDNPVLDGKLVHRALGAVDCFLNKYYPDELSGGKND